jgi:hypothetical protein
MPTRACWDERGSAAGRPAGPDEEIKYGDLVMPQYRVATCVLRHLTTVAVATVVAAMLTSCGAAKPPSARRLAARVSGCTRITTQKRVQMELQDVTCVFSGFDGPVDIATFANSSDERRWIADGGSPGSPDPHYPGCCVQGSLWAATVDFNRMKAEVGYWSALDPAGLDFDVIIDSIGGHQVNSPAVSH